MKVLKQAGYKEYSPPKTENADELWQKKTDVAAGGGEMYIDAYVYHPGHVKKKTSVEFQVYVEKENYASKTKLYSFTDLSSRDVEKIEKKARAIYIAILHI